jgi:hypothetical protein
VSWTFSQSTGELRLNGLRIGIGYSGHCEGRNNPDMQSVRSIGPIPRGLWDIGEPSDTTTHGPFVMRLTPRKGTETFGRSGFLIHGDSISDPGTASLGCVILCRPLRERVWASGDHTLEVTR